MFVIAPAVWSQFFPWAKGVTRPEDLEKNHGFLIFAKQFIGMLGTFLLFKLPKLFLP